MRHASVILLYFWLMSAGHLQAQQHEVDSLKMALRSADTDTAKVNLCNAIAHHFREINPDSTHYYASKAIRLARENRYDFGMAQAWLNEGNADVIHGQYPKALRHFEEAAAYFQKATADGISERRIKNGLSRAYASMGVVYSEENDYTRALDSYFRALKIFEELGQKPSISKAYNNIAVVYKSQHHWIEALVYLKKSLALQIEFGDESAAVTMTNMGSIYFEQHQDAKALEYYQRAQKHFEAVPNARGLSLLNNYLGDYYQRNDPARAVSFYDAADKGYAALGNDFGLALVAYGRASLFGLQGKYDAAIASAETSIALARKVGTLDQVKASELLLSELYGQTGRDDLALAHYKQYTIVKDSLENEANVKKFMRTEMDFEYDKREALLHEKNKRQQQFAFFLIIGGLLLLTLIFVTYNRMQIKRRLTLQKEVAEYEQKALHLQMNPHFVFNCLGSISSFIVQNGTDSAIKYLSKFSKLMRLTLEYSKGSLIPIDKEVEGLQNYLELEQLRFNKKFEFAITVDPDIEDDMALPPLLIQPFVENAILHGLVPKETDGRIEVHFSISNNQLVCTITDDGIGFDTSKALKENSVTAHQSMALEITRKRLDMMQASTAQSAQVHIEEIKTNNSTAGTKVTVSLPIQYTSNTKTRI